MTKSYEKMITAQGSAEKIASRRLMQLSLRDGPPDWAGLPVIA